MRASLLVFALLTASFCCMTNAAAEPPPFAAEALRPGEAPLPNGWTRSEDEPEDLAARIEAIAEKAEYDTFALELEAFRIEKAKMSALDVALLDLDEDPASMRKALDAAASKEGWTVRELGSPHRLLLVMGGNKAKAKRTKEHKDAADALALHIAHKLGDIAVEKSDQSPDSGVARKRQLKHLEIIGAAAGKLGIEGSVTDVPALAAAYVRYSRVNTLLEERKTKVMMWWGNEKNRAHYLKEYNELKAELDPLEKACADLARQVMEKGAPNPPRGKPRFMACAIGAVSFLEEKTKAAAAKAERLLEIADADPASAPSPGWALSARYNLACAYGFQGKTKEAIAAMRRVFESAEATSQDHLGHFYIQALDENELAGFRESDGGKQLLESVRVKVEKLVAPYLKRMAELRSQGFDLDD